MSGIKLIVGLGNPGSDYASTRHNVGFWWVDQVANENKTKLTLESKFSGFAGKSIIQGHEVWLIKPNTFMNASGRSVLAISKFYKIPPESILIVHDELDLPAGTIKMKMGGGHGGHNGLRDIISSLGTQNFWRIRLGIGHPGDRSEVVNYVLNAPSKSDTHAIENNINESIALLPYLVKGDFEEAMLELHTKKL